jgi:hypothetical protein
MKLNKLLKLVMSLLCIGLCLGCSTTKVTIKNFNDKEFYVEKKNNMTYYCMSDYYVSQILEAKIKKVNP